MYFCSRKTNGLSEGYSPCLRKHVKVKMAFPFAMHALYTAIKGPEPVFLYLNMSESPHPGFLVHIFIYIKKYSCGNDGSKCEKETHFS